MVLGFFNFINSYPQVDHGAVGSNPDTLNLNYSWKIYLKERIKKKGVVWILIWLRFRKLYFLIMEYENSTKIFQRNVLNLLRAKGITQARFARQLGVDAATINRIIKGSRGTSLDWLDKISRALGVSTTYLINPCAGLKTRFRENIVETFIRG